MSDNKSFSNYFNSSPFMRTLFIATQSIYSRHLKEISTNHNYRGTFDNYGTEKEKYLKSIMTLIGLVQSYFDDLDKVVSFLKVDKNKISLLYGEAMEIDDYYKYHYDNFIIRIVTSIDLCGKVGNLIFNLAIEERYSNWYSFATHPLIKNTDSAKCIQEFSNYLEDFKNQRHAKVHKGENPQNRFDKIVFWDTLNKVIGKQDDMDAKILSEHTNGQIQEAISEIEKTISETARLTFVFLESMITRLEEIVKD